MAFAIPQNHKFASVALRMAGVDRDLKDSLEVAPGLWAVFGPSALIGFGRNGFIPANHKYGHRLPQFLHRAFSDWWSVFRAWHARFGQLVF